MNRPAENPNALKCPEDRPAILSKNTPRNSVHQHDRVRAPSHGLVEAVELSPVVEMPALDKERCRGESLPQRQGQPAGGVGRLVDGALGGADVRTGEVGLDNVGSGLVCPARTAAEILHQGSLAATLGWSSDDTDNQKLTAAQLPASAPHILSPDLGRLRGHPETDCRGDLGRITRASSRLSQDLVGTRLEVVHRLDKDPIGKGIAWPFGAAHGLVGKYVEAQAGIALNPPGIQQDPRGDTEPGVHLRTEEFLL